MFLKKNHRGNTVWTTSFLPSWRTGRSIATGQSGCMRSMSRVSMPLNTSCWGTAEEDVYGLCFLLVIFPGRSGHSGKQDAGTAGCLVRFSRALLIYLKNLYPSLQPSKLPEMHTENNGKISHYNRNGAGVCVQCLIDFSIFLVVGKFPTNVSRKWLTPFEMYQC